jgi:hypothetical protein
MNHSFESQVNALQNKLTLWLNLYATLGQPDTKWSEQAATIKVLQEQLSALPTTIVVPSSPSSPLGKALTSAPLTTPIDLNQEQAAIQRLLTTFNTAFSALNFNAVNTFSIVAGSPDEIAFTTITNLIGPIISRISTYYTAIIAQKPADAATRKAWTEKNNLAMKAKVGLIKNARKLMGNSKNLDQGTQTACASVRTTTNAVIATCQSQMTQLEQTQQQRTLTPTEQAQYTEAKLQHKAITTYQNELQALIANDVIQIKVNPSNSVNKPVLNNKKMTVLMQTNNAALIAHELQHLIQVKKGQLGLMKDGSGTVSFLYDLQNEVEAYQIQYTIDPNSVPGTEIIRNGVGTGQTGSGGAIFIKKFADINTAAIQQMVTQEGIKYYDNLPSTSYRISDTLSKLNGHPRWKGKKNLKFHLKRLLKANKVKRVNSFFEELWQHNQNRKLTDKLYSIKYDEKKVPLKDTNKAFIWEESRLSLLEILQQYLKFTTK